MCYENHQESIRMQFSDFVKNIDTLNRRYLGLGRAWSLKGYVSPHIFSIKTTSYIYIISASMPRIPCQKILQRCMSQGRTGLGIQP